VGAAVGTLSGFLVPYLHTFQTDGNQEAVSRSLDGQNYLASPAGFSFSVLPNGFYCKYVY
jgi:hypothetical protein